MISGPPSASAFPISACYAVGAVGYGILLGTMAIDLAGGGHGVIAFLWIALSGLILWPIAGAAIAWAHRSTGRAVFVAAMSLHYLLTTAIVLGSKEVDCLRHVWQVAGWLVITYGVTYLTGQAALWWAFVSCARRARSV